MARFQQAQDALSGALQRLMVVVERYPELKANANFRDLQAQLEGTENRIAVERGRYNEKAQAYNTGRLRFPAVVFANLLGMKEKTYFQAQAGLGPGAERQLQLRRHAGARRALGRGRRSCARS